MSAMGTGILEIQKRDGRIVAFDRTKIVAAIMKAAQAVQGSDYRLAEGLADAVVRRVGKDHGGEALPTVEAIQDTIEKVLIAEGHARTAKAFILYRARRSRIREGKSELMDAVGEILQRRPGPAAKHRAIGVAASIEYYLNRLLPEPMAEAHDAGDWHIHGLSHYDQTPHSAVLPFRALLQHGFTSGHGFMRPPRRAATAAALTAVMLQAAQADVHGGLAIAQFDADLAAVLPPTAEDELDDAMESLVYGLNALVAGFPPRATLGVGLDTSPMGRAVTGALLKAVERGLGRGEAALRPHVAFALREGVNLRPGDPNFDLTRRAAQLAGSRPIVSFVMDDPGTAFVGHAGRLPMPALAPAGLGMAARISINMPRLAMKAKRDGFDPAAGLEEAIDLAAEQLRHRFDALGARPAAEFPFLMAQALPGTTALRPTDKIAAALRTGFLAINLVGLGEALTVLGGQPAEDSPSAQAEGLQLLKRAAARCASLSEQHGLQFVLQAAEAPGASERFARLDRRAFGIVRGVTEGSAYAVGVRIPGAAALLPGGCLAATRVGGPQDADAVLAWLHQGLAAGQRLLALDMPIGLCPGCGLTVAGTPEPECARCGSPSALLRPLGRRDGFLDVEA